MRHHADGLGVVASDPHEIGIPVIGQPKRIEGPFGLGGRQRPNGCRGQSRSHGYAGGGRPVLRVVEAQAHGREDRREGGGGGDRDGELDRRLGISPTR